MKQFLIRMISISIIVLLLIPIGLVCVSSVEVEENMQIAAQVEPNVTTKLGDIEMCIDYLESDNRVSNEWTYRVKEVNGHYYAVLVGCNKLNDGKMILPDKIGGYSIGYWQSSLFSNFKDYELVIPASVPSANFISDVQKKVMDWDFNVKGWSEKKFNYKGQYNAFRDAYEDWITYEVCQVLAFRMYKCQANHITVDAGNSTLRSIGGVLYNRSGSLLMKHPPYMETTHYTVPRSYAFAPSFLQTFLTYKKEINTSLAKDAYIRIMKVQAESLVYEQLPFCAYGQKEPRNITVHISYAQINAGLSFLKSELAGTSYPSNYMVMGRLMTDFYGTTSICTDQKEGSFVSDYMTFTSYAPSSSFPIQNVKMIPKMSVCNDHVLSLNASVLRIAIDQTKTLIASRSPWGTEQVSWSSEDNRIATVSEDGVVKAVGFGTTNIKGTSASGESVSCSVTVDAGSQSIRALKVTPPSKKEYKIGEQLNTNGLTVSAVMMNGSEKWVSVAVCNITSLESTTPGLKTITVSYGGVSAQFSVTVLPTNVERISISSTSLNMQYKSEETLYVTITPPDATNQSIRWESSDPSVVSVDANGHLKALKRGNAVIRAVSEDGDMTVACNVYVRYAFWQVLIRIFLLGFIWY